MSEALPPEGARTPADAAACVRLVPLADEHAGFVGRLYGDPQVMRHLGGPRDEAGAGALVRQALAANRQGSRQRLWIILDSGSREPIGMAGLTRMGSTDAELGLLLSGNRQARGFGQATIRALRAEVAGFSPGACLVARHEPDNDAMARLLASLGFKPSQTPSEGYLTWRDSCGVETRGCRP